MSFHFKQDTRHEPCPFPFAVRCRPADADDDRPCWAASEPIVERLEASLKDRKGVVVYLNGQVFPGRVTRMTADAVELTSREYAQIILRRDAIDGVACN